MKVNNENNESVFQISMPTFPVVVKIGHAHSGMGKASNFIVFMNILNEFII